MLLSFILELWQVFTVRYDLVLFGVEAYVMLRRFLDYLHSRRRRSGRAGPAD